MSTLDKKFFINHGFVEDTDKKLLSELFTKHNRFREINISVSIIEPYMLLAHCKEKNVSVETNCIQESRLILKVKRNREKFGIMNVLLDEIDNCLTKNYGNGLIECLFEVRNLRYSLHIFL